MLSRVADHLYWLSRYLERAEHMARLIGVHLDLTLDQMPSAASGRREQLAASLSVPLEPAQLKNDYQLTEALTFAPANKSSIVACITAARENAQQVREQISSEMWEQLNRLYLSVKQTTNNDIWRTEPHRFYRAIKEGVHLFQGITDSTMTHGEGWRFIQIGRSMERAIDVAALLDVHFGAFRDEDNQPGASEEYLEWIGLLKSCTAFEAYCKIYTANFQPEPIADFLLLNQRFPHSVCFSIEQVQKGLHGIAEATEGRKVGKVYRLVGRLRATLDFAQIDEIMAMDMHTYLVDVQTQCYQIHEALYQQYISYPIEAALAEES